MLSYENKKSCMIGVFNLEQQPIIEVPLVDGKYVNMISGKTIDVNNHKMTDINEPMIIKTSRGNYV